MSFLGYGDITKICKNTLCLVEAETLPHRLPFIKILIAVFCRCKWQTDG